MYQHDHPKCVHMLCVLSLSLVFSVALGTGCSRHNLVDERNPYYIQGIKHRRQSEYAEAAAGFEKCLRLSPQSAEAHLQLGMLYEDHLLEPVRALYHYKAYLRKRPGGRNAGVAEKSAKRLEQKLAGEWGALYGVESRTEEPEARMQQLQDEKKRLEEQKSFLLQKLRRINAKLVEARQTVSKLRSERLKAAAEKMQPSASGTSYENEERVTTYVVEKGDTLISIARRMYDDGALWDELRDFNKSTLDGRTTLRVGEKLSIPTKNALRRQ